MSNASVSRSAKDTLHAALTVQSQPTPVLIPLPQKDPKKTAAMLLKSRCGCKVILVDPSSAVAQHYPRGALQTCDYSLMTPHGYPCGSSYRLRASWQNLQRKAATCAHYALITQAAPGLLAC